MGNSVLEENWILVNGKKVKRLKCYKKNENYHTNKKQVFIIGSKGIPAAYGGFETFVEKLTECQVSDSIRYHVARMGTDEMRYEYNGAKCFNIDTPEIGPAKAIYYDVMALKYCIDYCKARPSIKQPIFYVLACRIGPFMSYFKRQIEKVGGKLYVNPDGHEWLRTKWSKPVRKYWKYSEQLMVKHADLLICDSLNIETYISNTYMRYNPKTMYIAYGSDTSLSQLANDDDVFKDWLNKNGLQVGNYYLIVGRFVPENNFESMIKGFIESDSKRDLAIITTTNNTLLDELERKLNFKNDARIKFVGTVYEQELLKKIRENAYGYIHGHEVGGTNPSLLEALSSTNLNLLLNVGFNREVGVNAALYWNKEELSTLINKVEMMSQDEIIELGKQAKSRIRDAYSWSYIVCLYEKLFKE